jgi:hypothetical protein
MEAESGAYAWTIRQVRAAASPIGRRLRLVDGCAPSHLSGFRVLDSAKPGHDSGAKFANVFMASFAGGDIWVIKFEFGRRKWNEVNPILSSRFSTQPRSIFRLLPCYRHTD